MLSQMVDRGKDGLQGGEVLELLRVSPSGPNPQPKAPEDRKHRSKQIRHLSQQLQSKRKLSVLLQNPKAPKTPIRFKQLL